MLIIVLYFALSKFPILTQNFFRVDVGMEHYMGKLESPGTFCQFRPGESFDMFG